MITAPTDEGGDAAFRHRPSDARLFAHPRLEIVAEIARRPGVSFRILCEDLALSDGNLSAHLRALEESGAMRVERTFDGRRRLSQYHLTDDGRTRLRAYVDWLGRFAQAMRPLV